MNQLALNLNDAVALGKDIMLSCKSPGMILFYGFSMVLLQWMLRDFFALIWYGTNFPEERDPLPEFIMMILATAVAFSIMCVIVGLQC